MRCVVQVCTSLVQGGWPASKNRAVLRCIESSQGCSVALELWRIVEIVSVENLMCAAMCNLQWISVELL